MNRLKTSIFHYKQLYLGYKSKQSIDMARPYSILMDFDYTKAKLCKIRPFSSYFCLSHPPLCSEKTSLCSEKTSLCSDKTLLFSDKTLLCSHKTGLCCSKTPLCSSKTHVYEKYVYERYVYEKQLFFLMKYLVLRCEYL